MKITQQERDEILKRYNLRMCGYTGPLGRFGLVDAGNNVHWWDEKYFYDSREFEMVCSCSH